jgi:hypothetical protein
MLGRLRMGACLDMDNFYAVGGKSEYNGKRRRPHC